MSAAIGYGTGFGKLKKKGKSLNLNEGNLGLGGFNNSEMVMRKKRLMKGV